MYRTVRTARLYQQIVEQIEGSVRSGQLRPGDQLPPERDLALQFGVSRTAVREAVKALCEKGLAEAQPGRGTFVVDGTSKVIRSSVDLLVAIGQAERTAHLAEVREMLEPEIAAHAAERIDERQLSSVREALAVMEASPHDADVFIEADLDFHLVLAEAAQNPLILALIDSIVGLLRDQRTRIFNAADGPEHGLLHHRRILDAVERRDPEQARAAMRAHLAQTRIDVAAAPPSDGVNLTGGGR
ncbi:MAG: FadR/GntR family transcriptional regulator [Acidobacteriota bacterium]